MNDDLDLKHKMDYIQQTIKEGLMPCVGSNDVESIKRTLMEQMEQFQKQRLISNHPIQPPKVEQLWRKWSLVQRAKWYFYNKFPLIRDSSDEIRKEIDEYNETAYMINETVTDEDLINGVEYVAYKTYPEHLTPNPKTIYVTDIFIRPNAGINFVTMDITLNPKEDK